MKKFLLISALVVASLANAQNIDLAKAQKVQFSGDKAQFVAPVSKFDLRDSKDNLKEPTSFRAPKPVEYDYADTYVAPGAFHLGYYEGLSGYSFAAILVPFMDSVVYRNIYGPTDWSVNGKLVEENSDRYVTNYGVNGMYYLPETADHEFEYEDETYFVKGTMYGNGKSSQYAMSAIESKFLGGGTENVYMTLCAMQTDTMNNSGGSDFYMVGCRYYDSDPYLHGTGCHLNEHKEGEDPGPRLDTLGVFVDNRGLMKIEKILIPIYKDEQLNDSLVIPADAVLRLAIFPATENGIDFSDTIASTNITRKDFVNGGATWGTVGTLAAIFYDTDIFGATTPTPIYVNGEFYVQITNFNESNCDFGIFSDFFNPYTGTTVFQHNGEFIYRHSGGGGGQYGQNLGISFDAYFPTLFNDTTTVTPRVEQPADGWDMTAPVEGGWAFLGEDPENQANYLYSNVDLEDWSFDYDVDWIDFAVDTTYWSKYSVALVGFYAEELPTDVQSREATVTVEADGATQIFNIIQQRGAAVVTTKRDELFDNKIYNVLGIEVGEDYKGVVIRNGEKFVR